MQRVLDARGGESAVEDEDLLIIRDNLIESFHRYERAQQQLMEILRGENPEGTTAVGAASPPGP